MPIAGILCEYPIACEIEAAILVPVKLAGPLLKTTAFKS
jgi:hypothetical protein